MYREVLLSLALNYQHIIFQLISWEVILGQSPESMAVDVCFCEVFQGLSRVLPLRISHSSPKELLLNL